MIRKNVLSAIILTLCFIMALPVVSFAKKEPGVVVEGNKCGLKVEAISKKVNTDNLNPGDKLYT
ncbi:MAG: hypothetical protein GX318_02215, partial [Clostridia bacterium]|nr:hypothetical protein [Clostridia bacterium]